MEQSDMTERAISQHLKGMLRFFHHHPAPSACLQTCMICMKCMIL